MLGIQGLSVLVQKLENSDVDCAAATREAHVFKTII